MNWERLAKYLAFSAAVILPLCWWTMFVNARLVECYGAVVRSEDMAACDARNQWADRWTLNGLFRLLDQKDET